MIFGRHDGELVFVEPVLLLEQVNFLKIGAHRLIKGFQLSISLGDLVVEVFCS